MSQENVEIVLRGVAAMNRGDPEAFNALCDARFEMHLVGAIGEPVSYVGADGVFQFFRDMGESWADWGFEVERARDLDQHVLITGRQRGRGRVSGVNSTFISASNQLGEFRSGTMAQFMGAPGSVVAGAIASALAATEPQRAEIADRGAAALAALRGEVTAPNRKKHRVRKFFLFAGVLGAAWAGWKAWVARKQDPVDAWTTPSSPAVSPSTPVGNVTAVSTPSPVVAYAGMTMCPLCSPPSARSPACSSSST